MTTADPKVLKTLTDIGCDIPRANEPSGADLIGTLYDGQCLASTEVGGTPGPAGLAIEVGGTLGPAGYPGRKTDAEMKEWGLILGTIKAAAPIAEPQDPRQEAVPMNHNGEVPDLAVEQRMMAGEIMEDCSVEGAIAMKAKRIYQDQIDEWLLDTGSTYNLVNRSSLDEVDTRTKIAARNADIETVSGRVRLSEEVDVEIPNLQHTMTMKSTQTRTNVLSIGIMCTNHNYVFHWDKAGPTLTDPQGNNIPVTVK